MIKKAAKSSKTVFNHDRICPENADRAAWQYGWTHYGTAGQTEARLHSRTRLVEIKDGDKWVRCASDAATFFTPGLLSA